MKKDNKESSLKSNRRFFDLWASTYDFAPFQFWMKRFHRPVLEQLELSGRGGGKIRVLDLSCGTGELLKAILRIIPEEKKNAVELYGIDFSEEMLTVARKKLSESVQFRKMDVHQLDFPSNYFDCVISTEAFHHYYNQEKALSEMERVAKKNGKMMVVDVNFFLDIVHRIFEFFEPGCVRVNNREEMRDIFAKAGLRNVRQGRNFLFSVWTVGEK